MSEQATKPLLALDEVVRIARSMTLQDGYHMPTVIADGSRQSVVMPLEQLAPTHDERAQQLFLLGMILAAQGEIGVLHQAFFISETWMNITPVGEQTIQLPSKDPQRKEILSIARMVLLPRQTDLVLWEMKRNAAGKLVQLEAFMPKLGSLDQVQVESPLLEAFVIGFLR